jgi:hypothetical protein
MGAGGEAGDLDPGRSVRGAVATHDDARLCAGEASATLRRKHRQLEGPRERLHHGDAEITTG